MTFSLTFVELITLLSLIGGGIIACCSFIWHLIKTAAAGHEKWITIEKFIEEANKDKESNKEMFDKFIAEAKNDKTLNKEMFDKFEAKFDKQQTEILALQTQTITRLEILETLKRTEQFFTQIVMQLNFISKKPLEVSPPDLQSPILKRQTQMDDRSQNRRQND